MRPIRAGIYWDIPDTPHYSLDLLVLPGFSRYLERVTNEALNRRRRGRVPVHLRVTVQWEGEEIPVESRNLSLKGLACSPDVRLKENACCRVVLRLAPGVQAVIKGRVVRAGDAEAAIDFLAMDPESFIHLKKIVEYHSAAPEDLARELLTPAFPLSRPRRATFARKNREPR